ncbi:hypothetical protein SAMN04488063_2784 [Halopelagius inordinatus]|uniref:DUF8141 domain-containing protein n=1 Tax=Halopelagius inordinatus TaxID=553467 RepID=A0A1I2U9C5_9EURY|nr:hypothetical protein [Halopelagius inordinatus]SFG72247.1 hypothetical protein SAMN04488063_2784 [Halopelagius inordinatus]
MFGSLSGWFESKPVQQQILVLAAVFDPFGFGAGYLLAPSLGVDPLMGGAYGLVAASLPMSLLVARQGSQPRV